MSFDENNCNQYLQDNKKRVELKNSILIIVHSGYKALFSDKRRFYLTKSARLTIISVFLTFFVSQFVFANFRSISLQSIISKNEDKISVSHSTLARQIALGLLENANESAIPIIAGKIFSGKNPEQLVEITEFLILKTEIRYAQKIAVAIAEKGAEKYDDANLIYRAGLEYYLGRFVAKDYAKAHRYLEHPSLRTVAYAQYFLGELLAADDNPMKDITLAIERLEFASDRGVQEAKARLVKIRSGNNRSAN